MRWGVPLLLVGLIGLFLALVGPSITLTLPISDRTFTAEAYGSEGEHLAITARLTVARRAPLVAAQYQVNYSSGGPFVDCILRVELTVEYENAENIQLTIAKYIIHAKNGGGTAEYTVASDVALSGTSPITATYEITKALDDIVADTNADASSGDYLEFHITVEVNGVGSTSGQSLTASITNEYVVTYAIRELPGSWSPLSLLPLPAPYLALGAALSLAIGAYLVYRGR